VTRRRLAALVGLLGLLAPVAATAQDTPLQLRLAKALRVPHVAPGRSAAIALDLASGATLYAQNPALPLAPASNEKLPLTYAALATLGGSYRIETDVLGAQAFGMCAVWLNRAGADVPVAVSQYSVMLSRTASRVRPPDGVPSTKPRAIFS